MAEKLDMQGRIFDRRTVYLLDAHDRPIGRELVFTYDPAQGLWETYQPFGAARRSPTARWHRRRVRVLGRDLQKGHLEYETFVMNGLARTTHWADLLPPRDFSSTDNESLLR
jgi:hypothetical protein